MPTPDPKTSLEIVPLTADRWDDVAALFGEGGDPKTCWCMFWRIRSKDWSFANTGELQSSFRTLVAAGRDPAPGLLAYQSGRAVGWVSVAPREDYERLTNSRVRPNDRRHAGLVDRLLRRLEDRAPAGPHEPPPGRCGGVCQGPRGACAGGVPGRSWRGPSPCRPWLHGSVVDVRDGGIPRRPPDRLAAVQGAPGHRPAGDRRLIRRPPRTEPAPPYVICRVADTVIPPG